MKKLLIIGVISFAAACNSGDKNFEGEELDSATNTNTEKNMNDVPLRTMDTTTNLMKDTMEGFADTLRKR